MIDKNFEITTTHLLSLTDLEKHHDDLPCNINRIQLINKKYKMKPNGEFDLLFNL